VRAFTKELKKAQVEMAIRKSRGTDISAACGQLRVERLGRRAPAGADKDSQVNVA
jgi:23S rRNA (adenine2503-C2)-methyltransferase